MRRAAIGVPPPQSGPRDPTTQWIINALHEISRASHVDTAEMFQPVNDNLTAIGDLATTDGNFIVGDGTTWVAENGATARTSLGLGTAAVKNTGTSGDAVPLLNGSNTWSAGTTQTFNGNVTLGNDAADTLTAGGTWSDLGAVTTVDINGGTIDGATVGAASASTGAFTALSASTSLTVGGGTAVTTIVASSYTPTLTNISNVDSSSAGTWRYLRINDEVDVWGSINIDPTAAANTVTQIDISVPVASNFAATTDLSGQATARVAQRAGGLTADTVNDRAALLFSSERTVSFSYEVRFKYRLI